VTGIFHQIELLGRRTLGILESYGYGFHLVLESLYWMVVGKKHRQRVRINMIVQEMMEIGIFAIPIITLLTATIGLMLAIQGIHALKQFGAEHQVVIGVSLSVVREFAPLITGILVAGRSGSALAARLSTMTLSNEVDALEVMGVNPVRYLVAPSLIAMVIMLPVLTIWANMVALFAAGVYVTDYLGTTFHSYVEQTYTYLLVEDVMHGLSKSCIFAVLIAVVGVVNGTLVRGGAAGVGRVTTSAVVHGITAIVLTDMIFAWLATQ
jgi:phospholipid/cholesterol/gamma-HCH transport system permease protein